MNLLKREHMVAKYAKNDCCRDRRMGPTDAAS